MLGKHPLAGVGRRSAGCRFRCANFDAGFTLTELVIAMVVLGVLASIAIPSFLGSRNNSYDKEAQASIQAVLRVANLVYQSQGDFSDGSSAQCGDSTGLAADLQRLEPGVDVVASSASSTNSRVVSVQAVQTWNSNSELLGCQGFYAVAFSSSGNCWTARFISEGKFLGSGRVSPVVVNSQTNTSNSAVVTWSALAVNGQAFGVLKPQSSAADGDNSNSMASIQTACKAKTQSTGAASLSTNYIAPSQFYGSWRDAVAAPTQPAQSLQPTCANGLAACVLGDTGPGGGKVFYVQAGGGTFTSTGSDCNTTCKYMEAVTSDQGELPWSDRGVNGCFNVIGSTNAECFNSSIYPLPSANQSALRTAALAIGMGMANTNQIYARMTTVGGAATSTYAAGVAWAYSNNGKTDWHLPSRDELSQLYNQRTSVGSFPTDPAFTPRYASSSERSDNLQYYLAFADGISRDDDKQMPNLVRPVRAFG